jgi:hypothetical protein
VNDLTENKSYQLLSVEIQQNSDLEENQKKKIKKQKQRLALKKEYVSDEAKTKQGKCFNLVKLDQIQSSN